MNILKKSFIFAMPAMLAGCGPKARYVITDKADNKIVYNQVTPAVDTTRHVMVFGPYDVDLYKCLSIGDTIEGYDSIARMITSASIHGRRGRSDVIYMVNGNYASYFVRDRKEAMVRDSIIREMNARQK